MNKITGFFGGLFVLALCFALAPWTVQARDIGGEPPPRCDCEACNKCNVDPASGSAISLTEGSLKDTYSDPRLMSSTGPTVDLNLTYNSYNADGSRANIDTVMGYGWTHAYNIFLFSQRGHMFRMDGEGRVTKYTRGPLGTFAAAPGYFETLVQDANGFTLTQKDKTEFRFEPVPDTPFLVQGPVFRLMRITDRNGNETVLTYTGGNLTAITDQYQRTLTLGYNAQNKLTTITDPLGHTTTLNYDATGRRLLQIIDAEGKSVRYSYNALFQLTRKIDRDGRIFSYLYQNGKPVAIRDGQGRTLFRLSNPGNWATDATALARDLLRVYLPATTRKTDGRGNVWLYDYDAQGYITKITAPDGAVTRFTYDPDTLMLASITDANDHTTTFDYDAQGNLIKQTDALGHMTLFEYEPVFNQMTEMTDPNGRVTTYDVDPANGNRLRETDPLGNFLEWTYDSNGNVLTERDKNGNLARHDYDAFGNRLETTDAVGQPEERQTTFTYDAVGNLKTRTDDNNHTTSFDYDGLNRLIREIDPAGEVTQTFYDGEGNVIRVVDRNGNPTVFVYDLRQRLIRTTDALGNFTEERYDGNDNRIEFIDKNSHRTSFAYDVQNRLITTTDAEDNTTSRTYDGVGNVLTETDANNHTTTYTYDALDRRKTVLDAEGNLTTLDYDTIGTPVCAECTGPTLGSRLVTKQTDGNGKVTFFKYDGLDRLVRQIRKQTDTADSIDPDDAVTRYTYDPHGNRLSMTEPNGNTTAYEYDGLHRLIKETNAAGDMMLFEYDGADNLVEMTAPNGNVTTYQYDVLDRLIEVRDSVGLLATYTYDPEGNRLTDCDGNGNCTTITYDDIYRLITVTDALGETTTYDYDPVGNLLQVTDREDNVTCHQYDDINRRIRTIQEIGVPDCSTIDGDDIWTKLEYDGVGNLIDLTSAKNGSTPEQCNSASPPADCETTSYAYDDIDRLIEETYPDPAPNTRSFAYDAVGNVIERTDQEQQTTVYSYSDLYFLLLRDYPVSADDNLTYDLSGRLLTAERGGWLVTFEYDGANRVIETTQNGETVTYVYDIPGRTRSLTYPGGRAITEHTDPRTRLDTIEDGVAPPIVDYDYDLGNRVTTRTYRNGVVASYVYNDNNWITALEHRNGPILIAGFGHDFDGEGNKLFERKEHALPDSEAYQYDDIYRLVDFKVGELVGATIPLPLTQTQYDLDKLGNWDSVTRDGAPETREHNAVNEITRLDSVDIFHDDNGNLEEDERYRYAYDEENRLIAVTRKSDGKLVGQYQYDALSRRVVKIADPGLGPPDPVETRYFHDDARIIEEQDVATDTLATYVYGNYVDEVLTMDRGGQTFYYHQNSLWSVAAITDSLANVVERYSYDAYGEATITNGAGVPVPPNAWDTPHSALANPWMFTGRQLDEETGLYYYRARYYDPAKGRFLQRDPLGYVDGMNLYEYVRGNPVNHTDPYGMAKFKGCAVLVKSDKRCCVEKFEVKWAKGTGAANLRLDITIKFKKDEKSDPSCCEYRQNVQTVWKITDGPRKGDKGDTSPLHDDNYSRADDTDGDKALGGTGFATNDTPGWDAFDAKNDLDYAFTAEQGVIDCCDSSKEIERKGPHTGTIKGTHPRTYGGVPKTL